MKSVILEMQFKMGLISLIIVINFLYKKINCTNNNKKMDCIACVNC
jgi:hypothetical protein